MSSRAGIVTLVLGTLIHEMQQDIDRLKAEVEELRGGGGAASTSMPVAAIAELALRYVRMEEERKRLVADLETAGIPDRERIAALLERSGILPTLGAE